MSDKKQIEEWKKITDPVEALWYLVDNWEYIGSDPYYRELNNALHDMAVRACPKTKPRKVK